MSLSLESEIKKLEEKLLHSDVRSNPTLLDELLAEDFEEVGTTGIVNNRLDVVDWLLNKENSIRWTLTNFNIRQLSDDIVLAKYHAQANNKTTVSNRTSIWKRKEKEGSSVTPTQWQMVFHQGTLIQDTHI